MNKLIYIIFLASLILCASCSNDNNDKFVPSLAGTAWNHQGWCKLTFNSSEYKIGIYSFQVEGAINKEIFNKQGKYSYKYPNIRLKHKNKDINCKIISDDEMILYFDENDPIQEYLEGTTELTLTKE